MIIKKEVITNADETIAQVDGQNIPIKSFNEHDHEGHCWLWMELEDGQEFISYDDGYSWVEPDFGGYW